MKDLNDNEKRPDKSDGKEKRKSPGGKPVASNVCIELARKQRLTFNSELTVD